VRERETLVDKIDRHNQKVYEFENKGPYSPMIMRGLESNRSKRQEFGKKATGDMGRSSIIQGEDPGSYQRHGRR